MCLQVNDSYQKMILKQMVQKEWFQKLLNEVIY